MQLGLFLGLNATQQGGSASVISAKLDPATKDLTLRFAPRVSARLAENGDLEVTVNG